MAPTALGCEVLPAEGQGGSAWGSVQYGVKVVNTGATSIEPGWVVAMTEIAVSVPNSVGGLPASNYSATLTSKLAPGQAVILAGGDAVQRPCTVLASPPTFAHATPTASTLNGSAANSPSRGSSTNAINWGAPTH
jgi:hypothetical protein